MNIASILQWVIIWHGGKLAPLWGWARRPLGLSSSDRFFEVCRMQNAICQGFLTLFSCKYFGVNSLHRDHFTQLEDPLQTETSKVTSATSDSVDSSQVLYYWIRVLTTEKTMTNKYYYRLEILL